MAERTGYRWYVSLERVKRDKRITDGANSNDARLMDWIRTASRFIENQTNRVFIPVTATKLFDVPQITNQALVLHDDLLSVTTLSDDNGTIASNSYFLYPANVQPKLEIQLLRSTTFWSFDDTRQQAISVAGTWGYSDDYESTGRTLSGAVTTTTATQIQVDNTPGIETGWCLLIDAEQMFVREVNGPTINVRRGVNGTTAATHDDAKVIYRYLPEDPIEAACLELVLFWYDNLDDMGVKSQRLGSFSVTYEDMPIPDRILQKVDYYYRMTYASAQESWPVGRSSFWSNRP